MNFFFIIVIVTVVNSDFMDIPLSNDTETNKISQEFIKVTTVNNLKTGPASLRSKRQSRYTLSQIINDIVKQIAIERKGRESDQKVQASKIQQISDSVTKWKRELMQNVQTYQQHQQTGFNNLMQQVQDVKKCLNTESKNIQNVVTSFITEDINITKIFEQNQNKQFDKLQFSTNDKLKYLQNISQKIEDLQIDVTNNKKALEEDKQTQINNHKKLINEINIVQAQTDNIINSTGNVFKKLTNASLEQQIGFEKITNLISNHNYKSNNSFQQILDEIHDWKQFYAKKNNATTEQFLYHIMNLSNVVNLQIDTLRTLAAQINNFKTKVQSLENKINNLEDDNDKEKINNEIDYYSSISIVLNMFIAVMTIILSVIAFHICCRINKNTLSVECKQRIVTDKLEMRPNTTESLPIELHLE